MARPLRIEFPDALYHVTARGDGRENIFLDDEDRQAFLRLIGLTLERFDACSPAWCLMDNHYHLALHTRQPNLARLMRQGRSYVGAPRGDPAVTMKDVVDR